MAIHYSVPSMLQETLMEMVVVADICIKSRKNPGIWKSKGCFGYPAAILLLSIVDSIGSYVEGWNEACHFKILNNKDYYNLNLEDKYLELIYNKYRNLLVHNAAMAKDCYLDIGEGKNMVFEMRMENPFINLVPFLEVSKKVVYKFLSNVENNVKDTKTLENILKK